MRFNGELRNMHAVINSCLFLPLHKQPSLHVTTSTVIQFVSFAIRFFSFINFHGFAFCLFAVLPPTTSTVKATKFEDVCRKIEEESESSMSSMATNSSQSSRRLIKADFALFKVRRRRILNLRWRRKRRKENSFHFPGEKMSSPARFWSIDILLRFLFSTPLALFQAFMQILIHKLER